MASFTCLFTAVATTLLASSSWGGIPSLTFSPVVTVSPDTLQIDVSSEGEESGLVTISAVAPPGNTIAALIRSGNAGALADNLSESGTNPKTLSLSHLRYTDVGVYTFTYTATDNSGQTGTGKLTINIVPEPAMFLSALASIALMRRRRV